MSSYNPLNQLRRLDKSSPKFYDQVSEIFGGEEYKQWVRNHRGNDLVGFINHLDKTLDGLDPASPAFQKFLYELRHVCGTRKMLPTSYTLSPSFLIIHGQPVASGGSGDVYKGTLKSKGLKVCVKRVRANSKDGPTKTTKALYQEVAVRKHLEHRSIIPFLGITPTPLQLVSEWMPNGDLIEYIKKHLSADRLRLLSDVAAGIHFLHSLNVVHGNLKGSNVFVDVTIRARITDFGPAIATQNLDSIRSASGGHGRAVQWTAPEILSEKGSFSKEADVFSFAMVMIGGFSGAAPFNNSPEVTVAEIMSGKRPPRPTHTTCTDELWTLIQRCWHPDPRLRPEFSEVIEPLVQFSQRGSSPPPVKPPTQKFSYASALKKAQQEPPPGYGPVGPDPPSLSNTASPSPRSTPQISSQKANYTSDPPESHGRSTGMDESRSVRPHASSRAILQGPPFDADYNRSGSRANLQNTLGGRNASRRNVSGKESRSDLERGSDGNDEGKYWSKARQDNLGASRSVVNVGDGHHQGGQNRNRSHVNLPNNLSQNHLGQHNQSRADLHDGGGNASRPELPNTGGETLLRRKSRKDGSGTNVGRTSNHASRPDLRSGNKSHNQSRVDVSEPLPKEQEIPLPQIHQDQRRLPQKPEPLAGTLDPRMDGGPQSRQERAAKNAPGDVLDSPPWKKLIRNSLTTRERVRLITTMFSDHNQVEIPERLSPTEDAQTFIDMMDIDEVVNGLTSQVRKNFLHVVYGVCGRQALVPRSLEISIFYNPNEKPASHGGFADIWKGQYCGKEVAAKVLRPRPKDDPERVRRNFCKEVVGWKTLRHPNVLPLLGVTTTNDRLVMVSEWMTNGNITEFLKKNPDVDRLELLRDATKGLIYMHDQGIIHGDLKGENILIDNNGCACLADFGLLRIVSDQPAAAVTRTEGGTIQWMSPELLYPERFSLEKSRPTEKSDCYAMGMVIYEVLSGHIPFSQSIQSAVIGKVLDGKRPERPKGEEGRLFTDAIWRLLVLCWKDLPSDRADARAVLSCLEGNPPSVWSPNVDRFSGVDGDDQLDVALTTSGSSSQQPPPSPGVKRPTVGGVTDHERLEKEAKEHREKLERERQEELEREKVKEAEAAARREKGRKEREEAARKAERARVEELQSQGDNPTPRSQPPAPTTPMTIKRFPDTPQPEPKKKGICGC